MIPIDLEPGDGSPVRNRRNRHIRRRHYIEKGEDQYCKNHVLHGGSIDFGMMRNDTEFLSMKSLAHSPLHGTPSLGVDLLKKDLEIAFTVSPPDTNAGLYICKVPFAQVKQLVFWQSSDNGVNFLIKLLAPPAVFLRTASRARARSDGHVFEKTHHLVRMAGTHAIAQLQRAANTQNSGLGCIDFGRWLSYRIVIDADGASKYASQICNPLIAHDVSIVRKHIDVVSCIPTGIWDWLRPVHPPGSSQDITSSLETLRLDVSTTYLPFEVLYQLEVCISLGLLHWSNLTPEFIGQLAVLIPPPPQKPATACRLLEALAASKRILTEPTELFTFRKPGLSTLQRLPSYCTMIRSATVTPTAIYFHSPVVDTSNRILRRYRHHEDRFLRVRFRDELYRGKLWSQDDDLWDEVFNRVQHVMKNGIEVGQRTFQFLAYGNSQFREHGAYFFAPTYDLSTDDIRRDMGSFDSIKTVAKYASRLGQSFSTTRTTTHGVQIVDIPDIFHNGYCFTDGVGKISLFMAQMIAQDMKLPSSAKDCPSLYQFRLAGCKGVLAIDANVKGAAVHVRPSQTKFLSKHSRLEICRCSQFSACFLNQQIILILSALGVEDEVLMDRLHRMLFDLERAMSDERTALRLLHRSIDINQTTMSLADLIDKGFMTTQEPFLISCLRLWRAWSIKYLKEKAKILIEHGAFLFGCVDEHNKLRGHIELSKMKAALRDTSDLPEIFVRVSEYDPSSPGRRTGYRVIKGPCVVARNPALHPGDVRVVMAVDKPDLYHLRDVVVFPQNGDRDIPSMCSGGDLDGDDYLVIWDQGLLPKQWNFPAMDYTQPKPVISSGQITVDHVIDFFVQHMKHDTLGRIATAHRCWADQLADGVKADRCLQLAALHSQAVDYAKTGVPAVFPKHLRPPCRPHWSDPKHTSRKKIYKSRKILGKLYDEVDKVDFVPAWIQPFDARILDAYELDRHTLEHAAELKSDYDDAIRKLMSQLEIKTEFEVWTAFVLQHNEVVNDYKCAETVGGTMTSIKQHFRKLVYERAGTDERQREGSKLGPFLTAMYTVTAREVSEYFQAGLRGEAAGLEPFISFPWLFPAELGLIANNNFEGRPRSSDAARDTTKSSRVNINLDFASTVSPLEDLEQLEEIEVKSDWDVSAPDASKGKCGRAFVDLSDVVPPVDELDPLERLEVESDGQMAPLVIKEKLAGMRKMPGNFDFGE